MTTMTMMMNIMTTDHAGEAGIPAPARRLAVFAMAAKG